jgi:hypothetical protein
MSARVLPEAASTVGRRLAGLGVAPQRFLEVLARRPLGREQQRLEAYLAQAHDLNVADEDAMLVLATVEHTLAAVGPVGRVDPLKLAGEVLAAQHPDGHR